IDQLAAEDGCATCSNHEFRAAIFVQTAQNGTAAEDTKVVTSRDNSGLFRANLRFSARRALDGTAVASHSGQSNTLRRVEHNCVGARAPVAATRSLFVLRSPSSCRRYRSDRFHYALSSKSTDHTDHAACASPVQDYLEQLHREFAGVTDGKVATYIPEL